MKSWTNDIDPSTIPDEVIMSQRGIRSQAKRKTYGGGRPRVRPLRPLPEKAPNGRACDVCEGDGK